METFLQNALERAYDEALDIAYPNDGDTHRARSVAWLNAIGNSFSQKYDKHQLVRVFWKQNDQHKEDFGLNELLHDVLVAECAESVSPRHGIPIAYIERALWQVESELKPDGRAAIIDFSKLVLGSAENKLFVGPLTHNQETFRNSLLPVAEACQGNVFAAFIPEPKLWYKKDPEVVAWQYKNSRWEQIVGELL